MNLTSMIAVYNEEQRIKRLVVSAKLWCDEVLVLDKGSQDDTRGIAADLGAKVVSIPFCGPGEEDTFKWAHEYASSDWILAITPSEQPTLDMAKFFRAFSPHQFRDADVIQLPVKVMTFGDFIPRAGPWALSFQPRLWNKHRATATGKIHAPLALTANTRRLDFRKDFFLLHCTHPSFESFIEKHKSYAAGEARTAGDLYRACRLAIEKAERHDIDFLEAGKVGLRSMVAWKAYHYMIALACLTFELDERTVLETYDRALDALYLEIEREFRSRNSRHLPT